MRKMLNIAVIGCGYWGPNLVRNLNSLAECNLTSVCDTDAERLSHMKGLYPAVKTTSEFDDLVRDRQLDAIVDDAVKALQTTSDVPTFFQRNGQLRSKLTAGCQSFALFGFINAEWHPRFYYFLS